MILHDAILRIVVIWMVTFTIHPPVSAQYTPDGVIPYKLDSQEVKPLRTLVDFRLQDSLTKELNANSKWRRLVSQKKMAVGIVDLRNPELARFARINGNTMMYAASLPKIAILLAVTDAIEKGEIQETEQIKSDMRLMISRSDNQASTRLIDLMGYEKIERVLTDPRYNLYDKEYGGGLWVGKRYAKTGERHPDPLMGISHGASVSQVCRFYYMMVNGQLVSHDRSRQMLDYMSDPELHHKFVNSLDKVAPRARLYRKSGSWSNYHSDSILVWGQDRKYILVALIEDADGENILRNLVYSVERILNGPT